MSSKKKKSRSQTQDKQAKEQAVSSAPDLEQSFTVSRSLIDKWSWLVLGAFALIAVILYGRTLAYDYVLDDTIVYTDNDFVKEGISGWPDLLTKESFQGYFGEQKNLVLGGRYRPLSLMTFALEYQLGLGGNSAVSHGVNIVLYLLGCWLLYLFLRRAFKEKDKKLYLQFAFWISILFLVHPLHTEVVANVKGRDEILAGLFSVLSLGLLLKAHDYKSTINYILAGLCAMLAYLSKENTIALALIAPMTLHVFRNESVQTSFKKSSLFILGVVLFLIIRTSVIGYFLSSGNEITDVMNNPFVEMRGPEKYATVFHTLMVYLKLLIWPDALTHDYYPYHIPIMKWSSVSSLLSIILHGLAAIVAGIFIWKRKQSAYWILFYLGMLVLVSNVFFTVGTFMNERFLYLPSIAGISLIVLAFAGLLHKILGDKSVMAGLALGILATTALSVRSYIRIPAWESALSLNRAAIKVSKNSARANTFMATALVNKQRELSSKEEKIKMLEEAVPYVETAARVVPNYGTGQKMKAGVYAELFKHDRDIDKLLKAFTEVARDRPGTSYLHEYLNYLKGQSRYHPQLLQYFVNTGFNILYKQKGETSRALQFLKYGEEIAPKNPDILMAMGLIYSRAGDARGTALIQEARQIDPTVDKRVKL